METKPKMKGSLKLANYKLLNCLDFFFCIKKHHIEGKHMKLVITMKYNPKSHI